MSIFFTSMWPYLLQLDPNAKLSFFGIVLASFSVGQAIGSPIIGYWSEKSRKFKLPIATGILIGFGCGNLSALRAYVSACSTEQDRNKAISYSFGSFSSGMLSGPILQSIFAMTFGEHTYLKLLDAYTTPAFFLSSAFSITVILVFYFFDDDSFAGVISETDESKVELPQFDKLPAFLCIFLWFIIQLVFVEQESLSTVLTIAMYDWTSNQAIIYNGYIETLSCFITVSTYVVLGSTRIGEINKRFNILVGLGLFASYFIVLLPWPVYSGKLDYNPNVTDGACTYSWCPDLPQVPLPLYLFVYIICNGIAFPFLTNAIGTLFSQILGPKHQGTMQGVYAFFGSLARILAPLMCTTLFDVSGYTWISVIILSENYPNAN
ncbi:unnamed protein product [Caenorhabditis angaria]|uniref:Major facilitator superfamily (MFS) profile domain-containing protein n=1 Tax=Caenorhabditis angaria TaxID=860376 RepID=A0A9P1J0P0_9PELO|nr:unnamed protein product [Caenorhabditis angaria]